MYTSDYRLIFVDETEDWLFEDVVLYHWWIWLRLKAATFSRSQLVGTTRIRAKIEIGEYATTIASLADKWNMDPRTVADFLDMLVEDKRIHIRKENTITIIRINEYYRFRPAIGIMPDEMNEGMSVGLRSEMGEQMYQRLRAEVIQMMSNEMTFVMQSRMQRFTQNEMPSSTTVREAEDKKININSSPPAFREREREFEFYENLRDADDEAMASMASTLGLSNKESVLIWMKKYWDFILSSGRFHKDQQDFNINFLSWYRKVNVKRENRNTNGKAEEKQGGRRRGSAESRRGSEGSAQPADDYDTPFPTE